MTPGAARASRLRGPYLVGVVREGIPDPEVWYHSKAVRRNAGVVELADTWDLKSHDSGRTGSNPVARTINLFYSKGGKIMTHRMAIF